MCWDTIYVRGQSFLFRHYPPITQVLQRRQRIGFQAEAAALQTGRSFSTFGGIRRMGLLSKKFTGFKSKLEDTVGIMGKSSWHGIWWNPSVYQRTMSLFSIDRSLGKAKFNDYSETKMQLNLEWLQHSNGKIKGKSALTCQTKLRECLHLCFGKQTTHQPIARSRYTG